MKIAVTSDWHLDASTAGFDRFDDIREAIDEIVIRATDERISLFLFLGDLCDPDANRAPRCVSIAIDVAQRLRDRTITSRWLVGNHDVIEDGSGTNTLVPLAAAAKAVGAGSRDEPPWVAVIDRPMVEIIAGVAFVWLPYVPRCASYDAGAFVRSAEVPDEIPIIVAGHLSISGIDPGSETHDMPRGRDLWLPREAIRERWGSRAFIVNGHYHAARVEPDLLIPGSLARLTFGEEANTPGFAIVEVNP